MPSLAQRVPAVKPNIAFFERYGAEGYAAYEETCHLARELGLVVIGDIKRGDIGSTAAAYAEGHFALADAVTVHPYLGTDSLDPFLVHCRDHGKGIFVLVRTSNPSSAELQTLNCEGRSLSEVVADRVAGWAADLPVVDGYSPVGAVVGATHPDVIAGMRERMPNAWLLLPGVGAQGATAADCAAAFDGQGLGAVINSSRGIMQCFEPSAEDWLPQIEQAATQFAAEVADAAGLIGGTT